MKASRCFIERPGLPALVLPRLVRRAGTYRAAVRWCWRLRRPAGLALVDLAKERGFVRQHLSDYLNRDDQPSRRDLPARRIAEFEAACANTFITQWLAARQRLTVLEELQAERAAA